MTLLKMCFYKNAEMYNNKKNGKKVCYPQLLRLLQYNFKYYSSKFEHRIVAKKQIEIKFNKVRQYFLVLVRAQHKI